MNTHPAFTAPEYIRIDSLPAEQRAEFAVWIYHQTCPVIPTEQDAEGRLAPCAWRWDYEHWLTLRDRGEVAVPLD